MGYRGDGSGGVGWAARSAVAAAGQVDGDGGGGGSGSRGTAGAGGKHRELVNQGQVASTPAGSAVTPTWGAFATIHTDVSAAAAACGYFSGWVRRAWGGRQGRGGRGAQGGMRESLGSGVGGLGEMGVGWGNGERRDGGDVRRG